MIKSTILTHLSKAQGPQQSSDLEFNIPEACRLCFAVIRTSPHAPIQGLRVGTIEQITFHCPSIEKANHANHCCETSGGLDEAATGHSVANSKYSVASPASQAPIKHMPD